jgi:hypothetical protein
MCRQTNTTSSLCVHFMQRTRDIFIKVLGHKKHCVLGPHIRLFTATLIRTAYIRKVIKNDV